MKGVEERGEVAGRVKRRIGARDVADGVEEVIDEEGRGGEAGAGTSDLGEARGGVGGEVRVLGEG